MTERIPAYIEPANNYAPTEMGTVTPGDIVDPDYLGTGTRDGTKFLRDDGTWQVAGVGGSGDVSGPASATDGAVARFADATGDLIEESPVLIDDFGNVTGVQDITMAGELNGRDVATDGASLDTHTAAASPHSGHATLVGGLVPAAELGTGSPTATTFLTGAQTYVSPGTGGLGNVVSPGGVTDNALVRYDGTLGTAVQNSPVIVSDAGAVSGVTDITLSGLVDGVDVSALAAAEAAHEAASAPHAGHATLVAGIVPDVQLGSGTADASVFLRGDRTWASPGGGGLGDVVGPGSAVDERVARFDGATGKILQSGPVGISDAGAVTGVASIAVSGTVDGRDVSADGAALDAHTAAAAPHTGHAIGIASTTDNKVPRFDGTGGKQLQDSTVVVDDSGNVSGVVGMTMTGNLTISGTVDGRDVSTDGTAQDVHIAAAAPHSGHAIGIASTTDNRLARYDGTGGKQLQDSVVVINDAGAISGLTGATVTGNIAVSGTVDGRDVSADGLVTDEVPATALAAASIGIFTPEMGLPGLGRPALELVLCEYLEAVATTIVTDYTKQESVSLGGSAINAGTDKITHADHRHYEGEQVKYTGVAGTGLSAAVQYYVKAPTKNDYQLSTFRDLSDTVDLTGNNAALAVTRYKWFYQDAAGGSDEFYVPIGLPLDSSTHRYPADSRFWDAGFDAPPLSVAVGGIVYVRLDCTVYNDTGEDRNVMLVIDPDSNVRAHGYVGADVGVATVTGSPTTSITMTAHGLLSHEFVYAYPNGTTAMPSPLVVNVGWWVKYIDANTIQLCSDAALTSPVTLTTDSTFGIRRVPYGSKYAIRACCVIPSGSSTRTPAVWELWGVNVGGNAASTVGTENMHWHSRLTIDQNAIETNPATANSGAVYHQGFRRSRPAKANSIELNRFDYGPKGQLWYFDADPAFTYAAGATITGVTSGATGKVVRHDRKAKNVLYKRTSGEINFHPGETITDGSNTLAIVMCERGPMNDQFGLRVAVSGADLDPLFAELNVQQITVGVSRKAMS